MKRHPFALALFLILGVGALGSLAHAQTRSTPCNPVTPNNAACITWAPVTTRTDGQPTNFPITYRVERQTGTTWATLGSVSLTRYEATNLAVGTHVFRVFALEQASESAPSNTASRDVAAPPTAPPNAPVITIAVVISRGHAPLYTIVGSAPNRAAGVYVGDVPIGRPCGDYVFTYRKARFHKVEVARKETWQYTGSLTNLAAPCAPRA